MGPLSLGTLTPIGEWRGWILLFLTEKWNLSFGCLGVTSKVQTGCGTERSAGEDTAPRSGFWEGWQGAQASTMFPSWTKGHSTVTLMNRLSVREPLPLWTSNFRSGNISQIPKWQSQAILEGLAEVNSGGVVPNPRPWPELEGVALLTSPSKTASSSTNVTRCPQWARSTQLLSGWGLGLLPGPVSQVTGNCFISGTEVLL